MSMSKKWPKVLGSLCRVSIAFMTYKILFFFFLVSFCGVAQNQDSIEIEALIMQAIQKRDSASFFIKKADEKYSNNTGFSTFFSHHFNKGKFYLQTGKPKEIFPLSKEGIKRASKANHPIGLGNFFNLQASAFSITNETDSAIFYFQKALEQFEAAGDSVRAAFVNNNIGNLFFTLQDFESAYKYISASHSVMRNQPNHPEGMAIKSVLGIAAAKTNRLHEAKKNLNEIMDQLEAVPNVKARIIALYGKGEVAGIEKYYDTAITFFSASYSLSEQVGFKQYQMLSAIGLMKNNIELNNFEGAEKYGKIALEIAENSNNNNTLYSINKNLAYAEAGLKNYVPAFEHLNKAHDLYQVISADKNRRIINDILLKYDTRKKEIELAENKNLLLRQEIELEQRRFWMAVLIAGLFMLVFIIVAVRLFYKQNIQKLKIKQRQTAFESFMKGEEEERQRLANEMHDGLAAELLGIRLKAEEIDPGGSLANDLSNIQEEARRIAHNLTPLRLEKEGWVNALKHFCAENSNATTAVEFFETNTDAIHLPYLKRITLYRVAQELIQNALKYAQAKSIEVQIIVTHQKLQVIVEDDGIGMSADEITEIERNLNNRLTLIKGEITIDSNSNRGTSCFIVINWNFD